MKKWKFALSAPIYPFLFLVAVLEILVRNEIVMPYLLPAPSSIFLSFLTDFNEIFYALLSTSSAAVIALSVSIVGGILWAVLLSQIEFLYLAIYPYAVFFQTVPIIAIAPLLVIWFGFGWPTVIASSIIVSIFPIIASSLVGLKSTDPALVDLFKLYSANRIQKIFWLRIPFSLPYIFSGIRISAGLSVIGAIVGEFIAGGGLGSVIDAARTQQRLDKVFAAIIASAILGLGLLFIVNLLSWLTLRHWHVSAKDL